MKGRERQVTIVESEDTSFAGQHACIAIQSGIGIERQTSKTSHNSISASVVNVRCYLYV